MKKFISVLFIALLSFTYGITSCAYEEYPMYVSDITAYINDAPITSFICNGYTYIEVEDLSKYGFNVHWNEYSRKLKITKKTTKKISDNILAFKFKPEHYGQECGTLMSSDIKIYYDDIELQGYSDGSYTYIKFLYPSS